MVGLYLVISLGYDGGRYLGLYHESVVEDVGHGHLASFGVDDLRGDPRLDVVVLSVGNLRVEVEQGAHFYWSSEPNVGHVQTKRSPPAVNISKLFLSDKSDKVVVDLKV